MKFLTETVENVQVDIQESTIPGVKDYYITGIFMQSGVKNKNGRIYPADVLAREMNRYTQEQIKTKRSVGELNHPDGPNINLDKVSHMITSLWVEGNNIYGKAKILNTPQGQIVKTLIDEGVQLGVSTRGFGSVKEERGVKMVQPDFRLATIDIVQDPSCQSAYVSTLMESKEFFVDDSGNIRERDPSIIVEESTAEEISTEIAQETIEEGFVKYNPDDYVSDTEISKFDGGYRPVVADKNGKPIHISQYSYPDKSRALEAADIYRTNYSKIHDDRLSARLMNHWKQKHSVFEDVLLEKFENALNEISKKTLKSYLHKSISEYGYSKNYQGRHQADSSGIYSDKDVDVNQKRISKRAQGISKAVDKLTEEQLDEISRKTLGSYINKAAKDVETRTTDSASFTAAAERHLDHASKLDKHMKFKDANDSRKAAGQYYKYSDKEAAKSNKRQKGIAKAVNKLTESSSSDKRIERLKNSRSILPASDALHDKSKSSLDDIHKTWNGGGTVQVIKNEAGKHKFLYGSGAGYDKIGTKFRAHHDQTWKDLGHHEVVNEIHLKDGKVVHKENDIGIDKSLPLYVYK